MLQQARTVQHPFLNNIVFVVAAVCLAGFPGGAVVKNPPTNVGDTGLLPGLGRRKWQPTPVFLPGEIPRTEEAGRLQSMGSLKSRTRLSRTRLSD